MALIKGTDLAACSFLPRHDFSSLSRNLLSRKQKVSAAFAAFQQREHFFKPAAYVFVQRS
jgi:hypothetical protein